jgi:hypothetical protein
VLIVGEQISGLQGIGIAMVLASIIGMEFCQFDTGVSRRFACSLQATKHWIGQQL